MGHVAASPLSVVGGGAWPVVTVRLLGSSCCLLQHAHHTAAWAQKIIFVIIRKLQWRAPLGIARFNVGTGG